MLEEIGADIPDNGVDRAHRIGKNVVKNGQLSQAIIVAIMLVGNIGPLSTKVGKNRER